MKGLSWTSPRRTVTRQRGGVSAWQFVTSSPDAAKWFAARAMRHSDELTAANEAAKEKVKQAMEIVDKVMAEPHPVGHYLAPSGSEANPKAIVHTGSGCSEVGFAEDCNPDELIPGNPVLLTAERNLVIGPAVANISLDGELLPFVRALDEDRILLSNQDREVVVSRADSLKDAEFMKGDLVRVRQLDDQTMFAMERVEPPKPDDMFEEPKVTFDDLGGIDRQIETLKWELEKRRLPADCGNYGKQSNNLTKILLIGPTGTGKSCLASAIAEFEGARSGRRVRFCNIRIDTWGSSYMFEAEARMAATMNAVKMAAARRSRLRCPDIRRRNRLADAPPRPCSWQSLGPHSE